PVRVAGIGGRVHRILCRTPTPVRGAEGLLVPDFGPIAITRLSLDFDLDTCLGSLLLVKLGGVNGARKRHVRSTQKDWSAVARFLKVEFGLVRIVCTLLNVFGVESVALVYREVISNRRMTLQDLGD